MDALGCQLAALDEPRDGFFAFLYYLKYFNPSTPPLLLLPISSIAH